MSASWFFVLSSSETWVKPDIVSCASAVLGSLLKSNEKFTQQNDSYKGIFKADSDQYNDNIFI